MSNHGDLSTRGQIDFIESGGPASKHELQFVFEDAGASIEVLASRLQVIDSQGR
jgi:hypothetical protein